MSESKQSSRRKPSTSRNANRQRKVSASRSKPKGRNMRGQNTQIKEQNISVKPPRITTRIRPTREFTPVALKQPEIPSYKTSKVDELAAKYERLLQTAWDPVPGIRLVINGEEIMKEMIRVIREEDYGKKSAKDGRAFYKSFLYKERFPMLCNYLSLWVKRGGGQKESGKVTRVSSTQEIFRGNNETLDSLDVENMVKTKQRWDEASIDESSTNSCSSKPARTSSPSP